MALGGRIAEEMVFHEITSGASSDIKMVTRLARHMVCDWGMSPMGTVAYGENQDHIFLGREISRSQNYSEETARQIDAELRRIVDEQYERAKKILTDKRDRLDLLAEALLQHETLEGRHVMEIMEHGELRSPVIAFQIANTEDKEEASKEESADKDAEPDSEVSSS
jgi:cell division protease FtsH